MVKRLIVVLGRGWAELWRPGNDAGSQPRIAEGAARDAEHQMGWGEEGLPRQGLPEEWGAGSD